MTNDVIIKIPGNRDISLPANNIALLNALDNALEQNSYEVVYSGRLDKNTLVSLGDGEGFSTYILFEFDKECTGNAEISEKIKEQIGFACAPEILEATSHYQLVAIDRCAFNFKAVEFLVNEI